MATKAERKKIAVSFLDKAFELYPEWKSGYNLSKPIYPQALANVDISKKQMAQVPLTDIEKSVLCGTILADTSFTIDQGYANARFQCRQSTRQFTWFCWKFYVILKEFVNPSAMNYSEPSGYQKASKLLPGDFVVIGYADNNKEILGKLKIASKAHYKLTALHNIICNNNRKTIERSWLNHMNNYFLMTIWLDDGSITNGRQGVLSFNATPKAEQDIFREYLLKVWGIETSLQDTGKVMANGKPNYRITIDNQESLLKLLRYIAPVVPVREMLYKVCFVSENKDLSQRWKTELKSLVRPEFIAEIDKIYAEYGL
jgi:hypothetical protein